MPEVWIDPGIGFGKTFDHNLALLAHLDELVATGFPVLVGTSRKGFLGAILGASDGGAGPAPVDDRLEGLARHRHLGDDVRRGDGARPRRARHRARRARHRRPHHEGRSMREHRTCR